ncbi:MAG: GNAT family N-acetyltransferase [Bacteroidales bacterium]|nr:GNAT family N-acetyltransferase [Bacteroidales bacterium]
MKIIDLDEQNRSLYFVCLEDWSDEMKESGDHKECWYNKMKDKGLRVKLAEDDNGIVGGMIQYLPIEYSNAIGKDLYFISCIWVHGYKQGRGNFRKQGMGKALIKAAEEDVKALGAKGIVAWGLPIPVFMRASFFRHHGYKKVDKQGVMILLWKKFVEDAEPPKWVNRKKFRIEPGTDKVTVTSFINGGCPGMNIVHERARRVAAEFPDKVILNTVSTFDKKAIEEWGLLDALFIDNKSINMGPPPSYEKIRKNIIRRMRKLKVRPD